MEIENIISGLPVPTPMLHPISLSLSQYVIENVKNHPDHVLMVDVLSGKELDKREVFDKSCKLALQLIKLGCKPGRVVGVVSENRIEVVIVFVAVLQTGAMITFFNPTYSHSELKHCLSVTAPHVIISSSQCYDKIGKANKTAKFIINLDGTDKYYSYHSLIKNEPIAKYIPPDVSCDSAALILFSSGSSGLPKGVMLKNMALNYVLEAKKFVVMQMGEDTHERILSVIPMFHGYGVMITLCALTSSQETMYVLPKFEEVSFLSAIPKFKITTILSVPPILVFFAKHPLIDEYDLSSVKKILCGAAPLSTSIEKEVPQKFPNLDKLSVSYGMTETTIVCTSTMMCDKEGTVGRLLPGFSAKISDIETGQALGLMKEGEICLKSPFLMKGYYNNEKANKETFDEHGWMHTGDVGYFDEEENLFVVDRIKDLIKYKGFQVAPAELENLLLNHSGIKEAAVIGVPDEIAGELPKAFVVKQQGSQLMENDIIKYVADQVGPHMKLRGGVSFIDEIPKNPAGKILRRELRKIVKSKL